jgi:hypothetical protein
LSWTRGLFINDLPIATFELKNSLTKQTVEDAVWQYKRDRDPRELLFGFPGDYYIHWNPVPFPCMRSLRLLIFPILPALRALH